MSSSSQNEAAVIDAGASDFMLTCDVTPQNYSIFAERDPDLVFRWTDANNFWLVRVTSAGQAVELAEMAGGVYTVHVSQSYAFASGVSYNTDPATHDPTGPRRWRRAAP